MVTKRRSVITYLRQAPRSAPWSSLRARGGRWRLCPHHTATRGSRPGPAGTWCWAPTRRSPPAQARRKVRWDEGGVIPCPSQLAYIVSSRHSPWRQNRGRARRSVRKEWWIYICNLPTMGFTSLGPIVPGYIYCTCQCSSILQKYLENKGVLVFLRFPCKLLYQRTRLTCSLFVN